MAIQPTRPQPQAMMTDGMISVQEITDTTAPVWDDTTGIQTLTAIGDGGLNATWGSATDATSPPVLYVVYIKADNDTSLFTDTYLLAYTDNQTIDIYTLADGVTTLTSGTTYYVGVRAMDKVRNFDTNEVTLNKSVSRSSSGGSETTLLSSEQESTLITK